MHNNGNKAGPVTYVEFRAYQNSNDVLPGAINSTNYYKNILGDKKIFISGYNSGNMNMISW